jgi:hypothetical protein
LRLPRFPEAEQSRVLAESHQKAEAKEEKGRKMIGKLLAGNLAQRTAEADRVPALKAAITHAGLSTRECPHAARCPEGQRRADPDDGEVRQSLDVSGGLRARTFLVRR